MIADWKLHLPGPGVSAGAILIGVCDTALAALALWVLLPASADVTFTAFLIVFVLATVLGVLSHVPGGLGVFEAVILLALPTVPPAEAIGTLALFRVIYYIAPFILATVLLAAFEVRSRPKAARQPDRRLIMSCVRFWRPSQRHPCLLAAVFYLYRAHCQPRHPEWNGCATLSRCPLSKPRTSWRASSGPSCHIV